MQSTCSMKQGSNHCGGAHHYAPDRNGLVWKHLVVASCSLVAFIFVPLMTPPPALARGKAGSPAQEASPSPKADPQGATAKQETNPNEPVKRHEEIVVTASGSSERVGDLPVTMQVLDEKVIQESSVPSVTELLSEHSVAYFDQWNASQTQVRLRGGATDPQGRDFGSEVIMLVDGRRSGTANLSKLSVEDVYRVEVLRGPASVIYGSQAVGGVINLITKDGLRTPESVLKLSTGSWGHFDAAADVGRVKGRFDYFLGAHGGRQGSYSSGDGSVEKMVNTAYDRYGGLLALGLTPSPRQRLTLRLRSDGSYHAGFRGSTWDDNDFDNRYNQSAEFAYTGTSPSGALSWNGQLFLYKDVDDFHWGSEINNNGGEPAPGFIHDNNYRRNLGTGLKVSTNWKPVERNTVLAGLDADWIFLRSTRVRVPVPGGPTSQAPPFDNNWNARDTGVFLEDVHRFGEDRLTLRGGIRADNGTHSIKATPNQPLLLEKGATFNSVTYRGGLTYRALDTLSLRMGVGTGFLAPTATQLAADFTTPIGGQRLGNPNLKPERTTGFELGAIVQSSSLWADLVVFHNHIKDRLTVVSLGGRRSQWANRSSTDVTGFEGQSRLSLLTNRPVGVWIAVNGVYNFTMRDNDALSSGLNTDDILRMPRYQSTLTLGLGNEPRWAVRLTGALHGPIWTDTEESLLPPLGPLAADGYIFRKAAFWQVNLSGRVELRPNLDIVASVNNLLNVNADPIFLALNLPPYISDPRFSNGGRGNSLPGRQFIVGIEFADRGRKASK